MNRAQRNSAKIKMYELQYRLWLKRINKSFGKYCLEKTLELMNTTRDLPPEIIDYFYDRINFDIINRTFYGVLKQNIKYFNKIISDKPLNKSEDLKLLNSILPQTLIPQAVVGIEPVKKQKNFFELEKDIVKSELTATYEKRKNQLDEFRESFLFNSPNNKEKFVEKYPEPQYDFTHTVGRTQVNNLNRDLSASMAPQLGVEKCRWITSGDERVRASHRALNNKVFSYDNLPSEYNDYNCRCTLEPIIDED